MREPRQSSIKGAILRISTATGVSVCLAAAVVAVQPDGAGGHSVFERLAHPDNLLTLMPKHPSGDKTGDGPSLAASDFSRDFAARMPRFQLAPAEEDAATCRDDEACAAAGRPRAVLGGGRLAAAPGANQNRGASWRARAAEPSAPPLALIDEETAAAQGADAGLFHDNGQTSLLLSARLTDWRPDRVDRAPGEDGGLTQLRGQASHALNQGAWRLGPELEVGAVHLALDDLRAELGSALGPLDQTEEWYLTAQPALALRGDVDAGSGVRVSPRLKAGATWLSDTEFSPTAVLLDAPTGVGAFTAGTPMTDTFMELEAGLDVAATGRFVFSLEFDRLISDEQESNSGSMRLNVRF
ncbi:MAG: autotransporter domain-containing protein [Maricaulaceae bacterium]|jgi:hypothetical protein